MRSKLVPVLSLMAVSLVAPAAAQAATVTVATTDDVNAGVCTLRDAITATNTNSATGGCVKGDASPTVDVINFSVPSNSAITLGSSLPAITGPVNVQGPGSGTLTVDGNNAVVPFTVNSFAGSATISGLTVAHGSCAFGCGVSNTGTLVLDHVVIDHNTAAVNGGSDAFPSAGGIRNGGTMMLTDSTVSSNRANATNATNQNAPEGGGIFNNGTLTVTRSAILGNQASADAGGGTSTNAGGGGIANFGTLNVIRSTISGNSASGTGGTAGNNARGGAIANANSPAVNVTIDRSTIAGNTATASGVSPSASGGGFDVQGTSFSVTSSTIAQNSAPSYANVIATSLATFKNTIVAEPQGGGADCVGSATSQGYNLTDGSGASACGFNAPTDQTNTNPLFDGAGLADNGGPTKTIALQSDSPAIDKGSSSAGETVDQRGLSRPSDFGAIANVAGGDGTDIGAFEAQDTVPPDTSITSGPSDGSVITDASPSFGFSATEPGSTFECAVDGGGFSPCANPNGIGPLADGAHTFAVRAIDAAHNPDVSPASRAFTVDTTAPDTAIDSGPADGSATKDASPSFGFSSNDGAASFECSLDGGAFGACSSPTGLGPLTDGQHTFSVRAVDVASNTDPSPASRSFTVDTAAPDTSITSGPGDGSFTDDASPSFGFSSDEPGAFECSVDGGAFASCSSPDDIGTLGDGQHTFAVRASDAAGNLDASPATRKFTVDTAAPETTLVKPVKGKTKHRKLKLRFRSSEPGSTFECKLDRTPFKACTSPFKTRKLKLKVHVFKVRATDRAGNADPTVAKEKFRVASRRR